MVKQVLVVDLQFSLGNDKQNFIKELAILEKGSLIPTVYHFKPPYPAEELCQEVRYTNQYCENKINGLKWGSGLVEYLDVKCILKHYLEPAEKIYVKGEQKKLFLEKYIDSAKIEDLSRVLPPLEKIDNFKTSCPIHLSNHNFRCAVKNCFNVYMYLLKEKILN